MIYLCLAVRRLVRFLCRIPCTVLTVLKQRCVQIVKTNLGHISLGDWSLVIVLDQLDIHIYDWVNEHDQWKHECEQEQVPRVII